MTENELYEYIKNSTYHCCFCQNLQQEVVKLGLQAIKAYKGMICGGIEDMQIRFSEKEGNANETSLDRA